MTELEQIGQRARQGARVLATCSAEEKNAALARIADVLDERVDQILIANTADLEREREAGLSEALLDRLALTPDRVRGMAKAVRELIDLPDPIGAVLEAWSRPNGLLMEKIRVPLGVVGIIYEARPNVTVDAATICLKSGNACILRGSSSAIETNTVLARLIAEAAQIPNAIQLVTSTDRESVNELMRMRGVVDVLIPRGGADLIRTVVEGASVPVIETGVGNCHIYVDAAADLAKVLPILVNAKTQRTSVCNAVESLLVHRAVASEVLPDALEVLHDAGVEVRGDDVAQAIDPSVIAATDEDYRAEFLDMIISVKVVADLDEAISHINTYGTGHTDAIISEDADAIARFTTEVDSACVMVNTSTRFADGSEFGFGAEIGISNQKLHARGPMGLAELTSYKYIVHGQGQVRP